MTPPRRSSAACCVGWLLWLKGWVAAKTATTLVHALLLWGFRPWSRSFDWYYNVKQRIPSPSKWQVQKMLLVLRNVAMLTFSVTSPICMHISWGSERLNKHSLSMDDRGWNWVNTWAEKEDNLQVTFRLTSREAALKSRLHPRLFVALGSNSRSRPRWNKLSESSLTGKNTAVVLQLYFMYLFRPKIILSENFHHI